MVNGFPDLVYRSSDDKQLDLGPTASALDLLEAVYRDPAQQLSIRIRCAMACLPFQSPKLGVSFLINDADIATRLDKAIERVAIARANDAKLIEAKPHRSASRDQLVTGGSVDARLPPPAPDARYRRRF